MQQLVFTILALVTTFNLLGQNWETQSLFGLTEEVRIFENKAYVAHRGGLLVVDLDSGEESLINPSNSSIPELGIKEIEIASNGHLWIYTSHKNQLYYYDGLDFQLRCDSISDIRSIKIKDDVLWILSRELNGIQGHYTFSVTDQKVTNHTNAIPGLIHNFSIDNDGVAWLIIDGQIGKLDNDVFQYVADLPESFTTHPSIYYQEYYIDSENRHWISRGVGGPAEVVCYKNGKWEVIVTNELIKQFYEFDERLYYNSTENFGEIIEGEFKKDYSAYAYPSNYDQVLRLESPNSFWLYSTNQGDYKVFRVDKEEFSEYGVIENFPSNQIYDIEQDCNGHLLSTDPNLLSTHDGDTWRFIPKNTFDPALCYLYEIIPHPNCKTFISSRSSLCTSVWEVNPSDMREIDILPRTHRDHQFGTDGSLYLQTWIGSDAAIAIIDSLGRIDNFLHPVRLNRAAKILVTRKNQVILSGYDLETKHGRVFVLEELEWRELDFNLEEGISFDDVIFEDSQNNLWFTNNNQLIEYDWEKITTHTLDLLNENSRITKMVEDKDGHFWLSTHNTGVIYWKRDKTIIYDSSNSGILSDVCVDLELIDDEYLWINHTYGLSKLKLKNLPSTTEEIKKPNTSSSQFSLYPNPTQSSFTLSFPHIEQRKIEIFSTDGRQVYSMQTQSSSLEILSLEVYQAGCYWVKVSGASGRAVQKLVVY